MKIYCKHPPYKNVFQVFLLIFIFAFFLIACTSQQSGQSESTFPTPTINPIFVSGSRETADQSPVFPELSDNNTEVVIEQTDTPTATTVAEETPTAPTTSAPLSRRILRVYGDSLQSDWSLENSYDMEYDPQDELAPYDGRYALAITPQANFGKLFFTVQEDSRTVFLHENVATIRFWLYSEDYIGPEDIGITILGSNEYPYWVANDDSVRPNDNLPSFIPTRLSFLGIEEDIPPENWVQIEIWLEDLQFDPDYLYVTGITIENDEGYLQTFYIDNLEIIIEE
ncbi:MAG: hypothetical protein H6658_19810 [Ardenticatenaceae bacterium]|nr:hypothetical protein [Ardenticatenaceae bacterium]